MSVDNFSHRARDLAREILGYETSLDTLDEMLIDPLWADGKHSGDCTHECHTCARCIVDDIDIAADKIIRFAKRERNNL